MYPDTIENFCLALIFFSMFYLECFTDFFSQFCIWLKPWRGSVTDEWPTSSVTESLSIRIEMLAIMVIVNLIVCSFLTNDQSFHIYNTHFDLLPLVMLKVMEIFAASFPCQKTYLVFAALFHAVLSRFYSKV